MAATSGGDIIEITYNNEDVGTGVLYPKGSEDSTYDNGGIRTNDDGTMIDGAGNAIYQMNRTRWSFKVKTAWDMSQRNDLETLSALATSTKETSWTFTNINGIIYKGVGKVVGDINGNGNSSTIDLNVAGSGLLQIIS